MCIKPLFFDRQEALVSASLSPPTPPPSRSAVIAASLTCAVVACAGLPQMYETPLFLAALEGQDKAVELLLDNGALVNSTDRDLNAPLHAAARGGHVGVAALLLERGGNPLQANEVGGLWSSEPAPARGRPYQRFAASRNVRFFFQAGETPLAVAQARSDHILEAVLSKADGTAVLARMGLSSVALAGLTRPGACLLPPLSHVPPQSPFLASRPVARSSFDGSWLRTSSETARTALCHVGCFVAKRCGGRCLSQAPSRPAHLRSRLSAACCGDRITPTDSLLRCAGA